MRLLPWMIALCNQVHLLAAGTSMLILSNSLSRSNKTESSALLMILLLALCIFIRITKMDCMSE